MASIQEPEIQFAQRLASNEKPIRTKAVKKLRKYINVRSQKATGGFTGDELLKLWKGLFYCLWMQDKPLLQEELSNQISTLIHSFHDIDGQLLYLESFLQTFKREWTGIDRLRMDKFFQLVRFMFRQTFELLKRKNWDSSVVGRFLDLLTVQLLQSGSAAPSGLQFHILDLYMTELAAVGSAELTAEQNLIFIEPFCKTAAKTKDRVLFRAICGSIFSTIIDQAPFAIEDLMNEIKAHKDSDSDSGQASEEDGEDRLKEKKSKSLSKKGKQVNGTSQTERDYQRCTSKEDEDDDFGHLEDSDTELPRDQDVGPVLQFDYSALAHRLFELSSRSSTPSHNRQKLYRIIKVLRDLSQGIFPQDEYPEEVSTDEDDDMFGSRKRMKRATRVEEDEEGAPEAKKRKGKKKEPSMLSKQNDFGQDDDDEQADPSTNNENKKKKRKKKKSGLSAVDEQNTGKSEQEQAVAQVQSRVTKTEGDVECSQAEHSVKEAQAQSSTSSVKVSEAAAPQDHQEMSAREESSQLLKPCITDEDQSEPASKKKKKTSTAEPKHEVPPEAGEERHFPPTAESEVSAAADASVSAKKKKKKSLKAELQTDAEAQITPLICEASQEEITTTTPAKKKKKCLKAEGKLGGGDGESQEGGLSSEGGVLLIHCEDSAEGGSTAGLDEPTGARSSAKKKSKKTNLKVDGAHEVVEVRKLAAVEVISEASQHTSTVPLNEKTKKKDTTLEAAAEDNAVTPLKKKEKRTKQKDSNITVGEERAALKTHKGVGPEKLLFDITLTTPAKKKKKSSKSREIRSEAHLQVVASTDGELPLDELDVVPSSKKASKKKRKIPVVFEYEADELEATAQDTAEKEADAQKTKLGNDVGEPSTTLSTKKSQKKSKRASGSTTDFITFQSNATVPTPLFCKTKGSPSTPLSSKKMSRTPKSESKKVTFGLKNNKMAEFRKTDRSLLVSPDGSSRVPFDPKQKPKFGVLKCPPSPFPNRKTSLNTAKSTPKQRPSAADYF